jgi:hypothetical protein
VKNKRLHFEKPGFLAVILKNRQIKDMNFLAKPTEFSSCKSSKYTPNSALYQLNLWEISIAAVAELREWQSGLLAVSCVSPTVFF